MKAGLCKSSQISASIIQGRKSRLGHGTKPNVLQVKVVSCVEEQRDWLNQR